MPIDVPTPFPDLDIPPRTPGQKHMDRDRNQEQITLLVEGAAEASDGKGDEQPSAASEDGLDELTRTLIRRRAESEPDVVRFENAPTDTGHWSLVAPVQLLVRHPDGKDTLPEEIDEILQSYKFTAADQDARPAVCPELAAKLSVYTYTDPEESKESRLDTTRTAIQQLQGQGVKASPHLVTALHQGPVTAFGSVVVKAAVGPAPTSVDDSDQAFQEAGFLEPRGGSIVAVIDTGIAQDQRTDGWLNEVWRTAGSIDPLDKFPRPGNGYLDFAAGHGTFAAGIVRLIDPDAQIKVYAALDSDGFASENAVACAMIQAVKDGAHVLNLSNGMRTVDNTPSVALELALEVIDEIAASQRRAAPVIVASAGNYGDSQRVWPAALGGVISVAALTAELEPADWSSRGSWVTCSCVGEGIVSTFVRGTEDDDFLALRPGAHADTYPSPGQSDSWAVWTGTSFAAPQIAGAISRTMREEGTLSPRVAAQMLLGRGAPIPGYGRAMRLLPGT